MCKTLNICLLSSFPFAFIMLNAAVLMNSETWSEGADSFSTTAAQQYNQEIVTVAFDQRLWQYKCHFRSLAYVSHHNCPLNLVLIMPLFLLYTYTPFENENVFDFSTLDFSVVGCSAAGKSLVSIIGSLVWACNELDISSPVLLWWSSAIWLYEKGIY